MSGREAVRRVRSWFLQRGLHPEVSLAYVVIVLALLGAMTQFYSPGKGFSYLIAFGDEREIPVRLSKVNQIDVHVEQGSAGYDAQYYVQIAMDPSLQNQGLRHAVDNLAYRARRILFPAVAYVLGFGQPVAILQVYALLNVLTWLILAALLLHWFPPVHWGNFFRWAGVLGSLGICTSLRNALVDGPSLLLITAGLYLAETRRPWWSTAVLAISGLGKETNVLAGTALIPGFRAGGRAWLLVAVRGILVGLPLALWLAYIASAVAPSMDAGQRNFSAPLAAYFHKWSVVLAELPDVAWPGLGAFWGACVLVSLSAQFLFFVLRPRWEQAWWKVGLSFSLLMLVLGDAVWEGYPGAACRVLLPMQVAFNVLVPSGGRFWRWVLLAGNLTLFASPFALQPPPVNGYVLGGNHALFTNDQGQSFKLQFSRDGWYGFEGNRSLYWSWTRGTASQEIFNPHAVALDARLRFSTFCLGHRTIRVKLNGEEIWSVRMQERQTVTASLSTLRLKPGRNLLEWETDAPPVNPSGDPRSLAFVVQNLELDLRQKAVEPAK